ncbi:MAG: CRISPR-associated endoribonuclease Cas6, partial [Chloroflexus sp.]
YITLGRRIVIQESVAVFRTLSPVLIPTKGEVGYYLLPHGEELEAFQEGLNFVVMEAAQAFWGIEANTSIQFRSLSIRPKIIYHYRAKL